MSLSSSRFSLLPSRASCLALASLVAAGASVAACASAVDAPRDTREDVASTGEALAGRAHVRLRVAISVEVTRHNAYNTNSGPFRPTPTDTDALTLMAAVQGTQYASVLSCVAGKDLHTEIGVGVSVFPLSLTTCHDTSLSAAVSGQTNQPLVLPIQVPYGQPLTTGFRLDDVDDNQVADYDYRLAQQAGQLLQAGGTAISVIPEAGSILGGFMQLVGSGIQMTTHDGSATCAGPLLPGPTGYQLTTFTPGQVLLADGGTPTTLDWEFYSDPAPAICADERGRTHVWLTLERDTAFAPKIHIEPPWSTPPHSFGGNVHRIGAALNASGRIEAVVTGGDEQTYQRGQWWDTAWQGLPSIVNGLFAAPVVVQNSDHQLVAFNLDSTGLIDYQVETSMTPSTWSAFRSFARPDSFMSFSNPGWFVTAPGVGQRPDGGLELFATDNRGGVWINWQAGDTRTWSGWGTFGAPPPGAKGQPTVNVNMGGGLEVYVLAKDGSIWGRYKSSQYAAWSGWYSMGGASIFDPVVARNLDGRLELFTVGTGNHLCHRWQSPTLTWSDWACDLGDGHGGYVTAKPAVINDSDGALNVFVRGGEGAVYHVYETFDARYWSAWESLGGNVDAGYGQAAIVATNNADGRIEVYYRSATDGTLTAVWQLAP